MNICNNIPLYLYNEMTNEERKQFEKHLNSCAECKSAIKLFGEVQKVKMVYRVPPNVVDSIFERTTKKTSIFSFSKTWKLGIAAAACLIIGVLSVPPSKNQTYNDFLLSDSAYGSFEEMLSINSDLDEFEDIFFI